MAGKFLIWRFKWIASQDISSTGGVVDLNCQKLP
jgi:hypothetical protein